MNRIKMGRFLTPYFDALKNVRMDKLGIKADDYTWQSGVAREITFIVTKDCQLACKY